VLVRRGSSAVATRDEEAVLSRVPGPVHPSAVRPPQDRRRARPRWLAFDTVRGTDKSADLEVQP